MSHAILPPIAMLAELTHRCPLQCIYCSNPIHLLKANQEMSTQQWTALFDEAADLGLLQIHLSGGEPTLRQDLEVLIAHLVKRGVYTNLITAGVNLSKNRITQLVDAGLDHVQISFQGALAETTELVGNLKGAQDKKRDAAIAFIEQDIPLTINAPVHRHNMTQVPMFIDLALELGAERLEIANVQYAGWALENRNNLMPNKREVEEQAAFIVKAQERYRGILAIDYVTPDYFAEYPKPCMGGWARDAFVASPDGTIMPCHAAATIPNLQFLRYGDVSLRDIWVNSPAFNAFRGTDWMLEPCKSCDRKEIDWGGCRCQAMAIAGSASATDPACIKSLQHGAMAELIAQSTGRQPDPFQYRRIGR
jgi:pyrroloquinoline quinone biosynthesis protein E